MCACTVHALRMPPCPCSPCLKLKPISNSMKSGFLMVNVEPYGGGLWHTWFDRDLSVAGRVLVRRGAHLMQRLVSLPMASVVRGLRGLSPRQSPEWPAGLGSCKKRLHWFPVTVVHMRINPLRQHLSLCVYTWNVAVLKGVRCLPSALYRLPKRHLPGLCALSGWRA